MGQQPFSISYNEITLKLGSETLDKNKVQSVILTNCINDHAVIQFTYEIAEDKKNDYIDAADTETEIEVSVTKAKDVLKGASAGKNILFKGLVTQIGVDHSSSWGGHYNLEVTGKSYTCQLDLGIEPTYTYQNKKMKVKELIAAKLDQYNGLCDMTDDSVLGGVVVQHRESDWQFFKRLASNYGLVLIANPIADMPRFDLFSCADNQYNQEQMKGLPKLHDLDPHYCIHNRILDYLHADAKEVSGFYYETVSDKNHLWCELGQCVALKLDSVDSEEKFQPLYIRRSTLEIKKSEITITYILTPQIEQGWISNPDLAGIAVGGTIMEVGGEDAKNANEKSVKDRVKIKLDSDFPEVKAEDATWFQVAALHTAEGNTGLYCMPEKDDYVQLYFPTENPGDAFVLTAVRQGKQNDSRLSDPNVKYFRTKFGKEIMFSDKEIVITVYQYENNKATDTKKVWIRLNQDDAIEIHSENQIKVVAQNDLYLNSTNGNITLEAAKNIVMSCQKSSITMNGDVDIKGSQFKAN
ncbi:MAG TPA: hypothetical protein DDW50_03825 [Firmicutes bacterium]|jgi:hypothetical protein|nr:hypothetical protein [Bacillota bacterium]